MKTLFNSNLISDIDIDQFSNIPAIRTLAKTACMNVSKVCPIYVLTRVNHKTGNISAETDEVISLYSELARAYARNSPDGNRIQIKLSVYAFDADKYKPYLSDCGDTLQLFTHRCTDYNFRTACPNVVSKIRNKCLIDHSKHDEMGWMYFMEDDMLLQRVVDYDDDGNNIVKTCNTWQSLLIAFAIWQYLTGESAKYDEVLIDKQVGLSGFPGYDSVCKTSLNKNIIGGKLIRVNNTRLTNCVLLNTRMMRIFGLMYETEFDCWDDLDMNLQVAAIASYNSIAIDFPICTTTNRPMVSDTSNIVYSTSKLNNYAAQMYYKWGDIIKFRPWKNSAGVVYAINAKLPDDFTELISTEWQPKFNFEILQDLRALLADDSLLNAFVEKHITNKVT